jgi:hypothetical protein
MMWMVELMPTFAAVKVPISIGHFAYQPATAGVLGPGFQTLIELTRRDRSASSLVGHPCSDHRRSRVPARNREYRTPRVGWSHFGGGGSGSRSAVPTYPQPPHKWTISPDSGRTGGSLRASRIASPHWGHRGAVSWSFRTSIELSEHDGHRMQPVRRAFPPSPLDSPILQPHVPKS